MKISVENGETILAVSAGFLAGLAFFFIFTFFITRGWVEGNVLEYPDRGQTCLVQDNTIRSCWATEE